MGEIIAMGERSGTPGKTGNGADPAGPGAQLVATAVTALLALDDNATTDAIEAIMKDAVYAGGTVLERNYIWRAAGARLTALTVDRAAFMENWERLTRELKEGEREARREARRADSDTEGADKDSRQGRPLELPLPEPWPKRVVGSALIKDISDYFTAHAVLPVEGAALVLALWGIHAYCPTNWRYTPRLHITSATKRAGKTRVLRLLKLVTCKAISAESITKAALFRCVAAVHPTLLFDEADITLADSDDLVAILNGGYEQGGAVLRTVGDEHEPRLFDTFSPVALAGIGDLPGTLPDRSIRLVMHRALRSERPAKITEATEATAERLSRQIMRWVTDHQAELRNTRPDMGDLINRVEDKWTPLYAIAAVAGGDLPARVVKAMFALTPDDGTTDSLGEQLLADMRRLFDAATKAGQDASKVVISSSAVVNQLCRIEGRPWDELPPYGRALTTNRLAQLLAPFRVFPRQIGSTNARTRGYQRADFDNAFARHLPAQKAQKG
jgi:hypothetical protein